MQYKRKQTHINDYFVPVRARNNQNNQNITLTLGDVFFYIMIFLIILFFIFGMNWGSLRGAALNIKPFMGPPSGSRY